MVPDELVSQAPRVERYYTPHRVAYWLRNWDTLRALAESPATASGLLDPRDGPTPINPRVGARQPGTRTDATRWADVLADLERAARDALPYQGLERFVWFAMTNLWMPNPPFPDRRPTLSYIATELAHRRKADVCEAFRTAARKMALALGWAEATEDGER